MRAEDLAGQPAAADRIEGERRAGRDQRLGELLDEARRRRVARRATAPCSRSSASCSGLRTMLTRPMPSSRQIRFSIWPRFDAAAVWTSALWPSRRIVSIMPSAVSGLTKHDAPSAALVPARQRQAQLGLDGAVLRVHRAAEDGDRLAEQRLRRRRRAGARPRCRRLRCRPASTGRAAPAIAFIAASGMRAVATVRSPLPRTASVARSAAPNRRPMSDGLIGVASTRSTTSSAAGAGVATRASESSSSPLSLTRERSWSPSGGRLAVMGCTFRGMDESYHHEASGFGTGDADTADPGRIALPLRSRRRALVAVVVPGREAGVVAPHRRAAPEVDRGDARHRRGELLRRPNLDVARAAHRQRRPLARQVLAEVGAAAGDSHPEGLGRPAT